MKPRIIIERHVPFVQGVFEPYADVRYLSADEIDHEAMSTADALITRTRTRCDATLLDGSPCRIIASATIGLDHVDREYCRSRGIKVVNVPGCNAPAVAQYVFASISRLNSRPLNQYTLGIVGVGHVGRIVEQWARSLDMRVLLCDPPRQVAEGGEQWVDLDTIAARADIITFHTPLTRDGLHPTYHLADEAFFGKLKRWPIVINSARGPVVDNEVLVQAIDNHRVQYAVVDCWEGEPAISTDLLERAVIATPHIAGYSHEGKLRASQAVVSAVAAELGLPDLQLDEQVQGRVPDRVRIPEVVASYDPMVDTARLKADPSAFESLRNNYDYRHEVLK